MARRARRASLIALCALACAAALPSAAGAVVTGIADNTTSMFSDPSFGALHVHEVRVGVDWDVAVNPALGGDLQYAAEWLGAAARAHVKPLVTFGEKPSRYYIPSVGQYTRAVRAFIRMFPQVKRFAPWNEPDWVYRPRLAGRPKLAAAYFNALDRNCNHCTVLAGELYIGAGSLGRWLRTYIKGLRYRPSGWALHNYFDVRGHTTSQLRAMLSLTHGPIWLDEISGVERRLHWPFPMNQSVQAAAGDERFLFSLPRRFHRVSRIYHYQWRAIPTAGWDSGLLFPDGSPRPAYYVVARAGR